MRKALQQAYPDIVSFIRAQIALPQQAVANQDALDKALVEWSLDVERLAYYLSRDYTREQLASAVDLMRASDHPGNADHMALTCLSVTEFKQHSVQLCIEFDVVETPFGKALLGFTDDGLCHVTFHDECAEPEVVLRRKWPVLRFAHNKNMAQQYAERIFGLPKTADKIPVWTYGTDFQIRVWQTLTRLPSGGLINYQQLATLSGAPRAARAVGTAMAKNHLSWLIPCHRVLRQSGDFGHYGGGTERKMAMVAYEAAQLAHKTA